MGTIVIIAAIDEELARLQKLRATLEKKEKAANKGKKSGSTKFGPQGAAKKKAKRKLSPAGRARIAEAQRKRWAAARKRKNP